MLQLASEGKGNKDVVFSSSLTLNPLFCHHNLHSHLPVHPISSSHHQETCAVEDLKLLSLQTYLEPKI